MDQKKDYHVHCNYNDHSSDDLTVHNVIMEAEKKGLRTVAFTEHVRKTSEWIPSYLNEIESEKNMRKSNLEVISGFEAKILPDGSIDCPERYASEFFLIASFHTTFSDKGIWLKALEKAIENPDVNVLGHLAPESSFSLDDTEIEELAHLVINNNKVVELNAKYHRPPANWLMIFKKIGVQFHLGSDAHSLKEIGNFHDIDDLISLVSK